MCTFYHPGILKWVQRVQRCLDQDPMAQTFTSCTFIGVGPSRLDVKFRVAQQPPGPKYNTTPSGAALPSTTGTDGAGCKASWQQDPSSSQAKIAISFAWSCSREEEARTQLQTKEEFQIK